ncbi:MAG: bifunctional pyr operon transcriptional regulator/uracil phosphoribosyltransferase PyrR [Candidatus Omnitrophica bacterium]|nr:bifunctional pyr operon transcriptional regulator/uracil phosphoribosyltransferase PyrR [Candidatus Omnitrophota bacterium]MCK5287639.1 bifunctional pyr operon transcriptional regulator/uracil phosphoribosyltransferase PyrR [Candidatus Omnitrophota bacterium]MCK5492177.1 bifunctional pyr operon transcriptional regulator/uracil phosphoribosyltransferase PyrR [Candidatus Omnitrophota bacterium]
MKKILGNEDIRRTLYRLTHQVLEKNPNIKELVVIGIQTRGVHLAKRVQSLIKDLEGIDVPLGVLDITLYRDDLTAIGPKPLVKETRIGFDLSDKTVILIDDVLFTGRTARAALDEIMDFGRPKSIQFLVLIDRGYRELPIRADFVGKNIPTSREELVEVKLKEIDGNDEVIVMEKKI